MTPTHSKRELRSQLLQQRRQLSATELVRASERIAANSRALVALRQAKHIASYRAVRGEINPKLIELQFQAQIYLPKIQQQPLPKMWFYNAQSELTQGPLGLVEPKASGTPRPVRQLDIVLVPLVAFTRDGSRLGQGGGYYDRTFAFRTQSRLLKRPLLVGLAHAFQEVENLPREPWDVPLDVIITDCELIRC